MTYDHDIFDMTESEFQTVSYKRKKSKLRYNKILQSNNTSLTDLNFNLHTVVKRILDIKIELLETDVYASVVASLKEGLDNLQNPQITKIICLGLGKIAYDPIFTKNDQEILSEFGVEILTENSEGKYKVKDKKTVLFYMPHCPKQLSNNLLWANWGLDLSCCIFISNSFTKIIESNSTRYLAQNAGYIAKIYPYVLEVAIINSFKYYEIFNDMGVHVFPKLNLVCSDLWEDCTEPIYQDDDVEFIKNQLGNVSIKELNQIS